MNIPHYCYHKNLSISVNYRTCPVKLENSPNPIVSCAMNAKSSLNGGMYTNNPLVKHQNFKWCLIIFLVKVLIALMTGNFCDMAICADAPAPASPNPADIQAWAAPVCPDAPTAPTIDTRMN